MHASPTNHTSDDAQHEGYTDTTKRAGASGRIRNGGHMSCRDMGEYATRGHGCVRRTWVNVQE